MVFHMVAGLQVLLSSSTRWGIYRAEQARRTLRIAVRRLYADAPENPLQSAHARAQHCRHGDVSSSGALEQVAQHYELIVTSSGSAGRRAAVQAAKLNETSTTLLDVLVVMRAGVGGLALCPQP
jgi:hypothetical protein